MDQRIVTPAPVLVFCYKRVEKLKSTIAALQQNILAKDSELYIFSDGPKNSEDEEAISHIRTYLKTIQGFKTVHVIESAQNKGLAKSIIEGVTKIFEKYEKVIVLEDDLITSANFLSFMNQALVYYKNKSVFSVAGFSFPIKGLPQNAVYFTKRASSWGWATWKDRWEKIDWEVKDYEHVKQNAKLRRKFNEMGSDLAGMLDRQMKGEINSWAIRWCFHQFKEQTYTVHPVLSKVTNVGFGADATHTNEKFNRYKTTLDQSGNTTFNFGEKIKLDPKILKQAIKHYSIPFRIYYNLIKLYFDGVSRLRL